MRARPRLTQVHQQIPTPHAFFTVPTTALPLVFREKPRVFREIPEGRRQNSKAARPRQSKGLVTSVKTGGAPSAAYDAEVNKVYHP